MENQSLIVHWLERSTVNRENLDRNQVGERESKQQDEY